MTTPLADSGKPILVEPDLDFIRAIRDHGGDSLKKCIQCGTCSATCTITPDHDPFPRKEIAWANWGMKERLFASPDIWRCYQCNDCSVRCPRDARPGDILNIVRRECIQHYAFPRFLGRWLNQPHHIPLLLGIPAALLALTMVVRDPIESVLGIEKYDSQHIIYSYSSLFPHWVLNTFFLSLTALVIITFVISVARFWSAMKDAASHERIAKPQKNLFPSIMSVLKAVVKHDKFNLCDDAKSRFLPHFLLVFGFVSLVITVTWMVTARYNPVILIDFKYPLAFLNPWKMLANVGGIAITVGCLLMIRDRLRNSGRAGFGNYFDWSFLLNVLIVALTGFAAELMHYLRLEPHRHVVYFVHLVFVFTLIIYMPYTKFAHMVYRTAALVFIEHFGMNSDEPDSPAGNRSCGKPEVMDDVQETATV